MTNKNPGLTLTLDEAALKAALADAVTKGIGDGVSQWDVQDHIRKAAEDALKEAEFPALVAKSLREILAGSKEALAQEVAEALATAIMAGTSGMAVRIGGRLLYGLRHNPERSYDTTKNKMLLEDCTAEVRKAMTPEVAKTEGGAS